jgi:SAM-dependent methyltransferase
MGSAEVQGPLWGAKAWDWAQFQEQTVLPLFGAVLDAARVTSGIRFLDAGCGAGLPGLLATLRGAKVAAFDASTELTTIAQQRLPDADVREADLEELPYADNSFDAVAVVNSLFYAADPTAALSELVRVTRPGGRIVVTSWGRPDQCEFGPVLRELGALLPPPPPGAPAGGPFAFSEPGALEGVLESAGLTVEGRGEVACPFVYPDAEVSLRGNLSAGGIQLAIAHSGEAAVRAALEECDRAAMSPDGQIRYDNVFIWVSGVRPQEAA